MRAFKQKKPIVFTTPTIRRWFLFLLRRNLSLDRPAIKHLSCEYSELESDWAESSCMVTCQVCRSELYCCIWTAQNRCSQNNNLTAEKNILSRASQERAFRHSRNNGFYVGWSRHWVCLLLQGRWIVVALEQQMSANSVHSTIKLTVGLICGARHIAF